MSDPRYPKRSGPGDYDDLVDTPRNAASGGQSDDPLAELARLIDEDPFADFNQRRQEPPLSQTPAPARTAFTEPPVEVPPEQYDSDDGYDDAAGAPASPASDSDQATPAQSFDSEADTARPSGGYELPDYEPPAQERSAYEPPAYEPPAPAPEPYRTPVAAQPPAPDLDADGDFGGSEGDEDATERLYADLAAASQRVEPTLERSPLPARTLAPEAIPAASPAPGRYDPSADLEANLLAGATEPEVDEFDFGDLTGGAAAEPVARAETRDLGGAAYSGNVYEQTDPVFDDSGHIPPYDGEVPVESEGRGRGLIIVAGLVGLVVLGGAGALAYRSFTGGGFGRAGTGHQGG